MAGAFFLLELARLGVAGPLAFGGARHDGIALPAVGLYALAGREDR